MRVQRSPGKAVEREIQRGLCKDVGSLFFPAARGLHFTWEIVSNRCQKRRWATCLWNCSYVLETYFAAVLCLTKNERKIQVL